MKFLPCSTVLVIFWAPRFSCLHDPRIRNHKLPAIGNHNLEMSIFPQTVRLNCIFAIREIAAGKNISAIWTHTLILEMYLRAQPYAVSLKHYEKLIHTGGPESKELASEAAFGGVMPSFELRLHLGALCDFEVTAIRVTQFLATFSLFLKNIVAFCTFFPFF